LLSIFKLALLKETTHIPYKAATIFSGHDEIVNFYGFNDSPNTIAHNVLHIHEYFHSYVSESKSTDRVSFIVTLPEFISTARPKMKADRLQLNKLLRSFQSRCSQRVFLIEASKLFESKSGSVNSKYFSDEYNLSVEGYDAIANLVHDTLQATTIPKMTSKERQEYIRKCFSSETYPLFKDLKNGTILVSALCTYLLTCVHVFTYLFTYTYDYFYALISSFSHSYPYLHRFLILPSYILLYVYIFTGDWRFTNIRFFLHSI